MTQIDPKSYGLSSRDRIEKVSESKFALLIDRKSRIVMADGKRILEKIRKIRQHEPGVMVILKTTVPMCSKTKAFLAENGVAVRIVD